MALDAAVSWESAPLLLSGTPGRSVRTEATVAKRHRGRGRAHRARKSRARRLRYLRIQARRLARRARLRAAAAWRPWWVEEPDELVLLEAGMPLEYRHLERVVIGHALVYRGEVSLDPLPNTRRIAIVFNGCPSRTPPVVMSDGPRTRRHRFTSYRPLPLCLWYSGDGPEQQWRLAHGLVELVDLTRLHLLREARFRQTGRWRGPELHLDDSDVPTNRAFRRALDRGGRRPKCWCGSGRRYIRCHGQVAEERELAALGLLQPPVHQQLPKAA